MKNSLISVSFILLFSPVCCLARPLTEPSKRNRTSRHCNLYQCWEMSSPKSMWGKRGAKRGARRDWSYKGGVWWCWRVIWSRLKPEQEGLVTEAYLWRRHWGSETVALWENLLQQTCRKGDMGRSLRGRRDEGTWGGKLRAGQREGWNFGEKQKRPWAYKRTTLLWFKHKKMEKHY